MINKVVQRLLVFFVGLPVVIALVFLKQYHHLALHIALFAFTIGAASELNELLSHNFKTQNRIFLCILAVLPSICSYVCQIFQLPVFYVEYVFIATILISMGVEVITASTFEDSNSHLATSSLILVYTGYLPTFISKMTYGEHSIQFLSTFILMVCFCDSIAWFFGNLFGKNNKGFIKASPNKSIAGFIGGFVGSVVAGILVRYIWPEVFYGSVVKVIVLGLLMALSGIIGDLVESVIKRSANCKDSGKIIPGRGGVLDSIDSIFFASPVFYLIISLIFCTPAA